MRTRWIGTGVFLALGLTSFAFAHSKPAADTDGVVISLAIEPASKAATQAIAGPPQLTSDDIYWIVLRPFLRTIANAEVGYRPGAGDRAYRTIYGGGQISSLAQHPEQVICAGRYCSSATGGFQFMPDTLAGLRKTHPNWYAGGELSEINQDLAAFRLLKDIGSWRRLISGIEVRNQVVTVKLDAVEDAIAQAASTWCGLPGDERRACAGQPQREMPETLAFFYAELAREQGLEVLP